MTKESKRKSTSHVGKFLIDLRINKSASVASQFSLESLFDKSSHYSQRISMSFYY